MITRRIPILAAVLVASSALAEPAFEVPTVPCTLLDARCTPSTVSSVLQTSRSEPEGLIRTVMGGGATPGRTGGSLPVTLELGPRNLAVTPGTTVLVEIAIGHLNRIVTPFADPVVHTVSNASTQVDGSVVYVATDTEEPVALYIGDGQGSTLALALTLAPRYVPPREVRLTVPGYQSKRDGNATTTRAAVEPVAIMPMLANASDRDGDGNGPAYVSDLVEQLRALAQGRMPEGFRIAKGSSGAKLRCAEGLKVRSGERAEGPASELVKARVANTAAHSITLEHDTCRPDAANATVAAMAAGRAGCSRPARTPRSFSSSHATRPRIARADSRDESSPTLGEPLAQRQAGRRTRRRGVRGLRPDGGELSVRPGTDPGPACDIAARHPGAQHPHGCGSAATRDRGPGQSPGAHGEAHERGAAQPRARRHRRTEHPRARDGAARAGPRQRTRARGAARGNRSAPGGTRRAGAAGGKPAETSATGTTGRCGSGIAGRDPRGATPTGADGGAVRTADDTAGRAGSRTLLRRPRSITRAHLADPHRRRAGVDGASRDTLPRHPRARIRLYPRRRHPQGGAAQRHRHADRAERPQGSVPALIRVKHQAILPNRVRADLRECFLLVGGFGDLASERAYLRGETFSCIRNDGGVIEIPIDGYAVGEDGKVGVRGRVVSKQGVLLAKALQAGFLQSFSQIFNRMPTIPVNTGTGTDLQFQSMLTPQALSAASAQGVGGAMDRLANYYLDMAEQLLPVIEVDAGRGAEFILNRGVSMKLAD